MQPVEASASAPSGSTPSPSGWLRRRVRSTHHVSKPAVVPHSEAGPRMKPPCSSRHPLVPVVAPFALGVMVVFGRWRRAEQRPRRG